MPYYNIIKLNLEKYNNSFINVLETRKHYKHVKDPNNT